MKRYAFRLEVVLRLRRAEAEQARHALAEANLRLTSLLLRRDQEAARFHELARRGAAEDLDGLVAERLDAELAAASLAAAERRVAEAAATAALAQVAWLGAHRRVVALERLDERRRAEHQVEAFREEIALIDDLTTARYAAAAGEAGGR